MLLDEERRVFEDQLRQAITQLTGPLGTAAGAMRKHVVGGQRPATDLQDAGVVVNSFQEEGRQWSFEATITGTVDGALVRQRFEGECQFKAPALSSSKFVARPLFDPAGESEDASVVFTPPDPTTQNLLRKWAVAVASVLVLSAAAGVVATFLALDETLDGDAANLSQLLLLAVAIGWTGSAGAALRSFMDRYRNGFEFDLREGEDTEEHRGSSTSGVRAQWPAGVGKERFSSLMAPTFVLRPLLGAVIAPIAYFTVSLTASTILLRNPTETVRAEQAWVVLVVAGLAGMFAKSIWDNLNDRAHGLFKAS